MRRSHVLPALLITNAPESREHEFGRRRKRYTVMMGLRVVCLLGAVLTYGFSLWLAIAFIVGGAALPWCAVLIANDGPPKKRRPVRPLVTAPLPVALMPASTPDRTIEG